MFHPNVLLAIYIVKIIDFDSWPRTQHFKMFNEYDNPDLSLCANVDISELHHFVKSKDIRINISLLYLLTSVANGIEEFRYRVSEGQVVVYDQLHPSTTVLGKGNLFGFCRLHYLDNFKEFYRAAERDIRLAKTSPSLSPIDSQATLYFTTIPWVSFTSITHPVQVHPIDAIPRISIGKFFKSGSQMLMPLSVQVHHGLVDGVHVGLFYERFQRAAENPEMTLKVD